MARLADVDAVCEFSYKAGYDQAVIDDTKKLEVALDIVSYLVQENKRLTKLVEQQNGKQKYGKGRKDV
jgi:hypothetical protein